MLLVLALAMLAGTARSAAQTEAVPASPSPLPSASPTPEPLRELLIEGGYTLAKVYNNYANGVTGTGFSYVASGAYRFGPWAVKFDQRTDFFSPTPNVPGPPPGVGFSTPDGGYSVVPPFTGRNTNFDVRAEHISRPEFVRGPELRRNGDVVRVSDAQRSGSGTRTVQRLYAVRFLRQRLLLSQRLGIVSADRSG